MNMVIDNSNESDKSRNKLRWIQKKKLKQE